MRPARVRLAGSRPPWTAWVPSAKHAAPSFMRPARRASCRTNRRSFPSRPDGGRASRRTSSSRRRLSAGPGGRDPRARRRPRGVLSAIAARRTIRPVAPCFGRCPRFRPVSRPGRRFTAEPQSPQGGFRLSWCPSPTRALRPLASPRRPCLGRLFAYEHGSPSPWTSGRRWRLGSASVGSEWRFVRQSLNRRLTVSPVCRAIPGSPLIENEQRAWATRCPWASSSCGGGKGRPSAQG